MSGKVPGKAMILTNNSDEITAGRFPVPTDLSLENLAAATISVITIDPLQLSSLLIKHSHLPRDMYSLDQPISPCDSNSATSNFNNPLNSQMLSDSSLAIESRCVHAE